MKIGIAIDSWKMTIFKKHFKKAGFPFKKHKGLTPDTILLKIETENVGELKAITEAANNECARSRMN